MSDFFAGLGAGFRFPDTQMNSGPLPSIGAGAPAGAGGDPDGRINFNSTLLEGITPYSYAKGARVGSDRNYQQIPHRIQQIVHQIWLPSGKCATEKINVSHVVDQGDVAFVINSDNNGFLLFPGPHMCASDKDRLARHPVFANLATVNYILAGVQRVAHGDDNKNYWKTLRSDLGMRDVAKHPNAALELDSVLQLVKTRLIPYGICAGSENQGGLTETGMSPVQAGVNFVTTMTVDGQNTDLINYWAHENLSAGDQLIFKLERKETYYYGLNHYYKETRDQTFSDRLKCWQLVPSVFRMGQPGTPYFMRNPTERAETGNYDCRTHGYWRIAQLMQSRKQCTNKADGAFYWNDDKNNLRSGGSAQLLQVLFAPVYKDMSVSDLPLICTLYENIEDKGQYMKTPMTRDSGQKAFDSVCKSLRLYTRMDESMHKKEYDVTTKELVRNIQEESDTTKIEYYRRQLHNHTESYDQYKKESENRFDEVSQNHLTALKIFVLSEDNCLSLRMICRKKQEMIFSMPSLKSTHTHLFRGLDYSGLSVELNTMDVFTNSDNSLLIDFIRPDTYFGCEQLPIETSHISNTVNRNIFTRYNDQILMGFLISTCKWRCDIEYKVSIRSFKLAQEDLQSFTDSERPNISQICQYETEMNVKSYDIESQNMIGYTIRGAKIIVEYRIDNGDPVYMLNENAEIATKINQLNKDKEPLEFEGEREKDFAFEIDVDKFVLDYERQRKFFEDECPYANIYQKALRDNMIHQIGMNVTMGDYGEMKVPPTGTAKHQNRTAFSSKRMPRDGNYWHEIEKLAYKNFEELTAEQLKKYGEHFETFDWESLEELNATEKALKLFIQEKKIKDTTDPVSEAPVTAPRTAPAEGMAAPAVSPPAPLQALSSEPISAAAQPAAKKSKVSLARQQAANAPVDST